MTNEELCVKAQAGDLDARNELILQNLDFIRAQAWELILRYPKYDIRETDLAQEGCIGMMRAVSTFDPERGNKFLTYAKWWIVKYMKKHIKGDVKNQPPVRTIHYTIWYENNHPTDTRKNDLRPQEDRVFRYVRVEQLYAGFKKLTPRQQEYSLYLGGHRGHLRLGRLPAAAREKRRALK